MPNFCIPFHQDVKARTLIARSPVILHVSKKILARESIFRNIDCNIAQQLKRGHSFLTQDQIKISSIYEKLVLRIQKAKRRQEEEIKQHAKMMDKMSLEIKYLKASVQEDKVQIWEAKNEAMELEELLEEEIEEYNALCEEMRIEQEGENEDEDGDFDYEQNEDNQNYQQSDQSCQQSSQSNILNQYNSQSQSSRIQQKQQQLSKPSCSIKNFISNRSITPTGLSNQNLEVGSGINLFNTQEDNGDDDNSGEYTQLYVREEQQTSQVSSYKKLLSFKKAEHFLQ